MAGVTRGTTFRCPGNQTLINRFRPIGPRAKKGSKKPPTHACAESSKCSRALSMRLSTTQRNFPSSSSSLVTIARKQRGLKFSIVTWSSSTHVIRRNFKRSWSKRKNGALYSMRSGSRGRTNCCNKFRRKTMWYSTWPVNWAAPQLLNRQRRSAITTTKTAKSASQNTGKLGSLRNALSRLQYLDEVALKARKVTLKNEWSWSRRIRASNYVAWRRLQSSKRSLRNLQRRRSCAK